MKRNAAWRLRYWASFKRALYVRSAASAARCRCGDAHRNEKLVIEIFYINKI